MNSTDKAEVLICGCGILGLTIAHRLLKSGCENIVIIEKEKEIGEHASGRNSGVLHAGIYYAPDSLKAKFCLRGNLLMKEYCKSKGIPVLKTGKVVVAKGEEDINVLQKLHDRATLNGAKVTLVDEQELAEIEPAAKTYKQALYSHYTAVVDPMIILNSLCNDLIASGKVKINKRRVFTGLKANNAVATNSGDIKFETFLNVAGAHSDKVAHTFGVGLNYKLIPFKGIYKKLVKEKSSMVKGNIYPVPDIRNPFLGVHFTKSIYGDVYIGPTAIPAFGRENYGAISDLDLEAFEILYRVAVLFFLNPKFRRVALTETQKYIFKNFFQAAKDLVKELKPDDVEESDKVGIRPQLVDWREKELVMDFVVIKDGSSVHILNAISPAFTSSMAFAEFVVSKYLMN